MRIVIALGIVVAVMWFAFYQSGIAVRFLPSYDVVFFKDGVPLMGQVEAAPPAVPPAAQNGTGDIELQQPLTNPPAIIKAVYATGWTAGSAKQMDRLIGLIDRTELNAIVIDVKDYTGALSYTTSFEPARAAGAVEKRIARPNALIKRLHDRDIYVIARVSVFQDQRLPVAWPDLALMSSSTGSVWKDHRGLMWVDPASRDGWAYNVGVAREALERGFDEINFDYIRFPSDGNLNDVRFPAWDETTPPREVIASFWRFLRSELPDARLSADVFGLTTVARDDLGIGQQFEDTLPSFDAVAPMVYPSHYAGGSFGYAKPAQNPYAVVYESVASALTRMSAFDRATTTPPLRATLRPWLQDFDLGATYTADMVRAQIQAVSDAASTTPELVSGWMLWDPENRYTEEALGVR